MRIKRGKIKRVKHNKILKQAKGYRMSYSKLYRRAREAVMHAGQYSFNDRRKRRARMRNQWIKIIAAGLSQNDVVYKDFIYGLKKNNINLDRKVLAEIAQSHPKHFTQIVESSSN